MDNAIRFHRMVAVSAMLGTLMVLGNVVTLFASTSGVTSGLFDHPALLLTVGPARAGLFHWSMVFDLFGYLAFAPIALFGWFLFKSRNHYTALLYTVCGLAYSLVGALGAVILGATLPKMIADYAAAPASQQEILRMVADTLYRAIAFGVWNPLEVLFVSIWFLGFGLLLLTERRGLAILALIIASFAILDPLGWILNNTLIFNLGGAGTALILVWSMWFGIDLLRRPVWTST